MKNKGMIMSMHYSNDRTLHGQKYKGEMYRNERWHTFSEVSIGDRLNYNGYTNVVVDDICDGKVWLRDIHGNLRFVKNENLLDHSLHTHIGTRIETGGFPHISLGQELILRSA